MAITIYGIRNCDTMKRARAWLDSHDIAYDFHDYKVATIERPVLETRGQVLVGFKPEEYASALRTPA